MGKKEGLLLAAIVFLALAFSGCVLQPPAQPTPVPYATPSPTPEQRAQCANLPTAEGRDSCNYEYAVSSSSPDNCWRVSSSSMRDSCLLEFAKRLGNETLCASILGAEGKNSCYSELALAKRDSSICDRLPSEQRTACYLGLNETSILCEGLAGDDYAHAICMSEAKSDVSFCSRLSPQDADICRREYALGRSDPSACGEISDPGLLASCFTILASRAGDFRICSQISPEMREECLAPFLAGAPSNELCYLVLSEESRIACLAKAGGNHLMCNLLNDTARIDACLEQYAIYFKDPRFCSYINRTSYANSCYSNLSIPLMRPELCANLIPELERDKCYRDYAIATNVIEVCDSIILDSIKMPCQSDIAYKFDMPMYCNRIEAVYYRERCYAMIIERGTHSPSECNSIDMDKWRDECYLRTAIRIGDSSFCSKIKSPVAKAECFARLA